MVPMATSQDHKRVGDNDTGQTPAVWALTPGTSGDRCRSSAGDEKVIYPTVEGMAAEGHTYQGFYTPG